MERLKNKVAIITGGCGGAGREIVQLFTKEGAKVVIADLDENVGKSLEKQAQNDLGEAFFVKTNVADEVAVQECIQRCLEKYHTVDILVNIACVMSIDTGYLEDVTVEMFDKDIDINLKGSFLFVKHLLPIMKNNHYGNIVNFSSVGASRGTLGHTIYGAAKAGVESMTRSIVAQYGKQGIRANCIRPGIMLNPVTLQNPGIGEYSDFMLSHMPSTRIGMGADAAPLALFLASDDSYYVNGQVITMDGGLTSHEPQWKEDIDPVNSEKIR